MSLRSAFLIDRQLVYLNHGSFGAVPTAIFEKQTSLRRQLEQNPHKFLRQTAPEGLQDARSAISKMLHCDADEIALTRSVTEGAQVVIDQLKIEPGQRVLTTSHDYSSVQNILSDRVRRARGRLEVIDLPTPLTQKSVQTAILSRIQSDVAAVVLSEITSSSSLHLQLDSICKKSHDHGAVVVVDGAHSPGQLLKMLSLSDVDYFLGALHKWAFCPRGSAFIAARKEIFDSLRPLISGLNSGAESISRRFEWPGTIDPTAWLCIPDSIAMLSSKAFRDGRTAAEQLSQVAERELLTITGVHPFSPPSMRCPLMFTVAVDSDEEKLRWDLRERGVWAWTGSLNGRSLLRVSTAIYNSEDDVGRLVTALRSTKG